jgi:RNA polymerase sigma-70 factor (ECF subfamily)
MTYEAPAKMLIVPSTENRRTPEDEADVILRIVAGERELFHSLIKPYERGVFLSAYSILQNESDAEEVVQEAVMKAFRHLRSFRGEAKFSTWLTQIVMNEARMRLRRTKSVKFESIDAAPDEESGDYTPAVLSDWREIPSEALERKELRETLRDAIDGLPRIYREVMIMRDVREMSIAETVKVLGIPESVVKIRLLRARLLMQKKLAPQLRMQDQKPIWSIFKRKKAGFPWF